MSNNKSKKKRAEGFFSAAYRDLKSEIGDIGAGEIKSDIRRDFSDVKDFYIDEKQHEQLKEMGKLKRWVYTTGWLLKALFFKLTPNRRILFIISIVLIFAGRGNNNIQGIDIIGLLVLIFILMLELKDKLLAKNELQAGRFVQHALMPERTPKIAGWEIWLFTQPANDVGGDLVDYQKIDEQKYGAALGDVVGKGLGAALFMAKLQATLRTLVPDIASLTKLGEKLNEIFHRDSLPNSFASLVFARFNIDSGIISILNAGHFPPIIIRNDELEEMSKGGAALGLKPDAKYIEQQVELNKNDMLFIYSDGLTEARDEQGNFFGETRLLNLLPQLNKLSVVEAGEKLVSNIENFIGKAKPADDLSIILLKRSI